MLSRDQRLCGRHRHGAIDDATLKWSADQRELTVTIATDAVGKSGTTYRIPIQ
jgi:hypothetical protein